LRTGEIVIGSDREYRIAAAEARKFARSIENARSREPSPGVDPRVHEALVEALESEYTILRDALDAYAARPQ
jgi:hypothetical protein